MTDDTRLLATLQASYGALTQRQKEDFIIAECRRDGAIDPAALALRLDPHRNPDFMVAVVESELGDKGRSSRLQTQKRLGDFATEGLKLGVRYGDHMEYAERQERLFQGNMQRRYKHNFCKLNGVGL